MGFKKLLASLGAGGASVETVLHESNVLPGTMLRGEVRVQGGSVAQQVQGLSVGFQARVEVERNDEEYHQNMRFGSHRVAEAFEVQPGAVFTAPFEVLVPWETPITMFERRHLDGMKVGLYTELDIARAVDASDLDPVQVHPLPAQQAILESFGALGFRFKSADLERGHVARTRQRLPFYQEIEFRVPSQYRGLSEVELTFVADGQEMDVVMEMDKKPGLFSSGRDTFRSFTMPLESFHSTDWTAYLNEWLTEVGGRRGWL